MRSQRLLLALPLLLVGCAGFGGSESGESITQRLMAVKGQVPPPTAVVESNVGAVDPEVDFSGVWRDSVSNTTLTARQKGSYLFVTKQQGGTEKWALNGSIAFFCGFQNVERPFVRAFTIYHARLQGPSTMIWDMDQAFIDRPNGPVQQQRLSKYWERIGSAQ